ncbi:hypothetical protein L3Q82_003741 [Scortum barcoo]|uniref:Uncharacterized protein n=1 Tax=Scortum barcoo TaxID=214431 RepID=A0ACB8X6N4_9TELE|nr:hypothetical protein L3Q82_003741 [Scortum barcoo]
MAASELIHDNNDIRPHVEVNVTTVNPPSPPHSQRVANGNPNCHALLPQPPSDTHDGRRQQDGSKLSSLFKQNQLIHSLSSSLRRHCDYVKISVQEERANRLPKEWWKTGVAFLYAVVNLVFTTVVITVVHERVPDKSVSPPLPDKFFDYMDRVPWAFTITEVNGLILVGLWLVQWLFLKHKSIIGRRCFFLIGTLYMYRCVTMYITTLPVPGKHMVCAPKLYNDSTGKNLEDFEADLRRSASGVVCILIAHEHYSIDVVIGYFATTRTFWWYHTITMANTHALRQAPNNYLSRTWWNPIFKFLERNVQTTVPIVFSCPVALPSFCRQRYRIVEGGRDE